MAPRPKITLELWLTDPNPENPRYEARWGYSGGGRQGLTRELTRTLLLSAEAALTNQLLAVNEPETACVNSCLWRRLGALEEAARPLIALLELLPNAPDELPLYLTDEHGGVNSGPATVADLRRLRDVLKAIFDEPEAE